MPDSGKWTARRGSQGDDWRWEGEPPAEPGAAKAAPGGQRMVPASAEKPAGRPSASILAAVVAAAAGIWAWITSPVRKLTNRAQSQQSARSGASRQDFTGLIVIVGALILIAAAAVAGVFMASALDDDEDGASPPAATTPATETDKPATPAVLVPPEPDEPIALSIWANELDAWWFGILEDGAAAYKPGDEVFWLLRWRAEPGESYEVTIVYKCIAQDGPMIDVLRGAESAGDEMFEAEWGPGSSLPDAAVPIPDTADSPVDDGAPGLLYLYGGEFTLLPAGPDPADGCEGERSITVPVEAAAGEVLMMGSAWLAHPDDHAGASAADTALTIEMRAEVLGVGNAGTGLPPGTVVSD